MSGLVITGDGGFTVITREADPVPVALIASIVEVNVPVTVGVPVTKP